MNRFEHLRYADIRGSKSIPEYLLFLSQRMGTNESQCFVKKIITNDFAN